MSDREPEHPIPFVAPLDQQGLIGTLVTLRQLLGPDKVLRALTGPGGSVMTRTGKTATSRSDLHVKDDVEKWYEDFGTMAAQLIELKDRRASPAGYAPYMLFCKKSASNSYRAAVETTYRLGRFRSEGGDAKDSIRGSLVACGYILARLSKCDCWTTYIWPGGSTLPYLAIRVGLWYPEAQIGLPANMHKKFFALDASPTPVRDEKPSTNELASFQSREEISHCWSVRLQASGVRAVVFLNWRNVPPSNGPDRHALNDPGVPGWMEDTFRDKHKQTRKRDAEECLDTLRPTVYEPECLVQSARIMSGWLQEQVVRAKPAKMSAPSPSVLGVQNRLFAEFREELSSKTTKPESYALISQDRAERLAAIASTLLGGGDHAEPRVYPVYKTKRGTIIDYGKQKLTDWQGGLLRSNRVSVKPQNPRQLVAEGSGISAQAIAWHTSILMREVQQVTTNWKPHETALRRRLLSEEGGSAGQSELAIPVFAGSDPIAVIGVSSPVGGSLSIDLVRKLELLSLAIGSISRVCRTLFEKEVHQALFARFEYENKAPWDVPMLWRTFTKWAINYSKADLGHIASWGAAGSIDRSGVSASEPFLDELQHRVTDAQRGGEYRADRSASSEALACFRSEQKEVKEHGVSLMLKEQLGVTTRRILQGQERHLEADGGQLAETWLGKSLKCSIGIGLSPHPQFNSTACLWLGWAREKPQLSQKTSILRRIDEVGGVYSALVLLHQLHEFTPD